MKGFVTAIFLDIDEKLRVFSTHSEQRFDLQSWFEQKIVFLNCFKMSDNYNLFPKDAWIKCSESEHR